jgi:alkylated DNA repair dioxygenase AlkB
MSAPRQLSLFAGVCDLVIDETFSTAVRHELDATSWVDVVPRWLSGDDAFMARLIDAVPFEQHQRWMYNQLFDEPRLTAEYPDIAAAPEPFVRVLAGALSRQYGVRYDGLWLNLYRDHRDSSGWHRDWTTCKRSLCVVPVLSLGAPRRFLLKPRGGGRSTGFTVDGGDLVVMGGRCQREWLHCVPKQARPAGPRVSLNFESTDQKRPG